MTEHHVQLSPVLVETVAGLSAGTISTLAVHPLDVVKTRLQIQKSNPVAPANALRIFQQLLKNERPIQSLYRGLSPSLLGNGSSWAIFFHFKSVVERRIIDFRQYSSGLETTATTLAQASEDRNILTPLDYFFASGVSGIIVTLSTNPIWVLKTRMLSSDKGNEGAYISMCHGAKQIFAREGVRGFYKGSGISLLGNCHGAVQFGIYEPMKNLWRNYSLYVAHDNDSDEQRDARPPEKLGNAATLVISGSAKIFAGTVTYPFQVLRSRLQTYHSEESFGRGIIGVARNTWIAQGWKGFYQGLGTHVFRVLPATWVTFLVYENVRHYLPSWMSKL